MDIQTITWDTNHGWSSPIPEADERETLVLVFADGSVCHHPDEPLHDIVRRYAGKSVIGCSTAGQLSGGAVSRHAITATIATFDKTRLPVAAVEVDSAGGARRSGRLLGAALEVEDLRGVLVISDGLVINGTALAAGISDVLPGTAISGGLAGGGRRIGDTWILAEGEPRSGWVAAVGFAGDSVELGFGSGTGWDPFGPERVVTRSHGNVLYELDGQPALSLYHDYLGDRFGGLPGAALLFPLSVRDFDNRTTVRTVLSIDELAQSICFAGDVPQGSVAQLMHSSPQQLVEGAHYAAVMAATGREQLAIAIGCIGRRLVLGQRSDEELEAVVDALQPGTSVAGFYGYGELSTTDGRCDLHNQTMTITTISESAA